MFHSIGIYYGVGLDLSTFLVFVHPYSLRPPPQTLALELFSLESFVCIFYRDGSSGGGLQRLLFVLQSSCSGCVTLCNEPEDKVQSPFQILCPHRWPQCQMHHVRVEEWVFLP